MVKVNIKITIVLLLIFFCLKLFFVFNFLRNLLISDLLFAVNFETWHLELIVGLVILISSCRYLLLNIWLDFAESSEAANKQVSALVLYSF